MPSSDADVLLDVRDLVKHYPVSGGLRRQRRHSVKAVDGVSLQLRRGETLGVVGESGCGKSTLAKLLMLLETPNSGAAEFEGRDMFSLGRRDRTRLRRDVQLIMQDPYGSLNPRMTVEQIVGEPFDIHRDIAPRGDRRKLIQELLSVVGLDPDHHLRRYPHQFSGGQRQRIGIARALALRPKVIVCDEPVSALDVSIQAQILNLLSKLQQGFGLSFIFIAHDLSVVRHLADRVAVMYLGRIVETGTEAEIYDKAEHPYTQALLSAALDPSPDRRHENQVIQLTGDVPSPLDPPPGCRFHTRCWLRREIQTERGEAATELCETASPFSETEPAATGHHTACHFAPAWTPPIPD
ncbi:ABC transporter ATP-binding protein [Saccharopolyspora phatthalungensis]|uniref:Oligopeptide/dipeptide ABC transporter ATP-binding protein n=1 Tax=Saccharopolyspora phatthalungensis TaxID=664693 RepID=A0A840QGX9_9PSEU|nr:oligopeptide/dipeptide ABC transporter ATP-binding protein [Saccharopolyspora phatthalungensis]MBB5159361.1 oligopeptide/dipeptide ABC transporter ATP-binding protein [Saccharopolyspora phatthalungensis]